MVLLFLTSLEFDFLALRLAIKGDHGLACLLIQAIYTFLTFTCILLFDDLFLQLNFEII